MDIALKESFQLIVTGLVATAGATEAFVQLIKKAKSDLTAEQDQLLALITAIIIAVATFVFLVPPFAAFGANIVTGVACGVIGSRGSNFVHDFLNIVNGYASVMKLKGSVANQVQNEQ